MRTAITALWKHRCEVRYGRTEPSHKGYAAFWMGELGYCGRDEPVTVPVESAQTVRKVIRMWITRGAEIPQRSEPGVPQIEKTMADTQQERKEEHKKQVLQVHALDKAPPEGVQRVWTDGSQ